MERPTMRFAAMLVAGVAGLAPSLAGCGQTEPTKSTNQGATSAPSTSGSTATTAVLPSTVDFNDPKELAAALASLGIDTPAVETVGPERSVVDGSAFPTWPSGDVRKAGLKTYRVDVSASFDGKAFLKFFQGKKELYAAPFDPAKTETIATIPAVVVESLKTGDKVTWGVYFEKKSVKPITVEFTVVDKAAAAKKVGEVEANKGLSGLGRMIAKAQVLKNYSFLSEALTTYVEITKADDTVTSVYADMVDCLRRLKLKNTPLFADAQMRMTNVPSPSRKGFATGGGLGGDAGLASRGPSSSDIPDGNKGKMAPIGPMATPKTAGNGGGLKQGGGGLPPIPTPPADATATDATAAGTDPMDQGLAAARALTQAALNMRNRADAAARAADLAKKGADAAQAEADALNAKVTDFTTKAAEARAKALDMSNGLTDAQRQNEMDKAQALERAAADAKAAADAAAAMAAEKGAIAEKLAHEAQNLDAQADTLEKNAQQALGVVDPTNPTGGPKNGATPPPGTGPLDPTMPKSMQMQDKINALKVVVQAAQANLAAQEARVNAAQAAFNLTQGPPMQPSEVVTAAKAELDAAQAALAEAGGTLEQAQKALEEASK